MKCVKLVTLCLIGMALIGFSSGSVQAWKTSHHPFIVDFSISTLEDDNYTYLSMYLIDSGNLKRIKDGVSDCDRLDLALNHYYDPVLGTGLGGATPATTNAQVFFDKAVDMYESGDDGSAWYYLGWSLHCVQDLMVPFHAHLDPLNGHSEYEAFADQYKHFFALPDKGTYEIASNASDWVKYAASTSYPYYDNISGVNATPANFDVVLTVLNPKTIGLTAGYIKFFADEIGMGAFKAWVTHRGYDYVTIRWDASTAANFSAYEIYLAQDPDDLFDDDPIATIKERDLTQCTIDLTPASKNYVKVRAVSLENVQTSNLLEASPSIFWLIVIPLIVTIPMIVIVLFKTLRRRGGGR